ncbi:MAG: hypothetical protein K1X61_13480 [Chitinophagales bacterium]|nr:hypothetical protein [Chitinophagales bacterium]
MKFRLLLCLLLPLQATFSKAQDAATSDADYRNFPVIISLQFQNFALPFQDLKSNFGHVGIALGTEVSLNGKQNWAQQFQAGFYFNKDAGNGFFTYTQTVYRPAFFKHFFPELKAGIGWQRIFHPVQTFEYQNGQVTAVKGGKSQLMVPLGISVGYNKYSTKTYVSPFISYQVVPALFYNDGIPLNFYSLVQVGTRIHFNY